MIRPSQRRFAPGKWLAHFQTHAHEFGYATSVAYLRGAQRLTAAPVGVIVYRRLRGDTLFYDPVANEFAAVAADGVIILTYFRPHEGSRYWQRLIGRP